jgi:uncharacterized membrane protein
MPDIGPLHPQIVHFVVALGFVGVAFRLVSLTGILPWTKQAATALLLIAAVASVGAAQSGTEAHGPAERIPGAREVVQEHEERGEWARNMFLLLAVVELAAWALRKRGRAHRVAMAASGLVGIAACAALYRAAEEGGELVYSYAGGIGFRSGDSTDVQRLLVAGLYHRSRMASAQGAHDEAARLVDELARQKPDDPSVTLMTIQSRLRDRNDPVGALTALAAFDAPTDNPRFAIQKGLLSAEALAATGATDSARIVLNELKAKYPRAERPVNEALAKLK